jgi:hypothetical protein
MVHEPTTADACHGAPLPERTQRHLRLFEELTDICMGTARALAREADQSKTLRPGLGLEIARVAKAVRLTLAMESKIAEGRLSAELKAQEARARHTAAHSTQIAERREDIATAALITIRERGDENETLALMQDLDDVLADIPDLDIQTQPIGTLAMKVCHALNLPFDPDRFTEEAWATEERALRHPASPYAAGAKAWRDRGPIWPGEQPARPTQPTGLSP